ncbi:MAG TPA: sucrase ferredoxin [Gaiellaceae bacterium]|nr:sucrase ferredoxin [Gaiellaceae bacterium]
MIDPRCADVSQEAGERLVATAVNVENWLLVEVRGTWPRDVSAVLTDAEPGSATMRAWLDGVPSSRLLFIRRPGRAAASVVFVVRAFEAEAEVRRIEVAGFEDLDDVDLKHDGDPLETSLVLVCGHGTRDACCALRGNAVFGALAEHVPPGELWISSHQGGHRFAANVLVLPAGIQLGRVAPDDAVRVVDLARAGSISLDHYRGRTAYSTRVQAAEVAARASAGLSNVRDLAFVADDGERVRLARRDGLTFDVAVDEVVGPTVPSSCGAAPEAQTAFTARLA